MRIPLIVATLVMIGLSPAGYAASDSKLRATYCMSVLQAWTANAPTAIATLAGNNPTLKRSLEDSLRNRRAEMARLASFLIANSGLEQDMSPLIIAAKQGQVDKVVCDKEREAVGGCWTKAIRGCASGDVSCFRRVDLECGAPTCARVDGCEDTSFLPY